MRVVHGCTSGLAVRVASGGHVRRTLVHQAYSPHLLGEKLIVLHPLASAALACGQTKAHMSAPWRQPDSTFVNPWQERHKYHIPPVQPSCLWSHCCTPRVDHTGEIRPTFLLHAVFVPCHDKHQAYLRYLLDRQDARYDIRFSSVYHTLCTSEFQPKWLVQLPSKLFLKVSKLYERQPIACPIVFQALVRYGRCLIFHSLQ